MKRREFIALPGTAWFETALARLLTMRVTERECGTTAAPGVAS